eukprot:scaffold83734_cov78-Phaeocystis_antarctica.AAC.2
MARPWPLPRLARRRVSVSSVAPRTTAEPRSNSRLMNSSLASGSSTRAEASTRIVRCFALPFSSLSSPFCLRAELTLLMAAAKAFTSMFVGAPPSGATPAAACGPAARVAAASKIESSRSRATSVV